LLLTIALKGYDELNEQYVYIGDAIEAINELVYIGKCLVKSKNKLDFNLCLENLKISLTSNTILLVY